MQQQVYFVGTETEVAHHAAPLKNLLDVKIVAPEKSDVIQPGDLAVFYSEHFDRFRDTIRKLKERKVATLYMIDGILEWRNAWENRADEPACPFTMRPVLCDKVACIGMSQAQVLASWGNESKIEVIGVPRFDALWNAKATESVRSRKRVLVMTAKCPAYDRKQKEQVVASLKDLKNQLEQIDVDVVWRLTAGLDQEIGVAGAGAATTEFTGKQLAEVLQQVDAVITTPSTAMLEAMLLELPVAVLDYTNSPNYVQAAWRISADSQIALTLSEILDPPETKIVFQRYRLAEALLSDGHATERLHKLISGMLELTARAVGQAAIEFPPGMLPYPGWSSAVSVGFDHKSVFPHAAFQSDDSVEDRAELAHARREIQHLHREIAQLKSELGTAHEIFDEIHRHPVAGPIVRARQKIIDLFKRIKPSANTTSSGAAGQ